MKRGWRFRQNAGRHGAAISFFAPKWAGAGTQRAPGQDEALFGQHPGQDDNGKKPNDFNAGQDGQLGQLPQNAIGARARDMHAFEAERGATQESRSLSHGTSFYPDHPDHPDRPKSERELFWSGCAPLSLTILTKGWMPRGYGRCPCCAEFGWLPEGPDDGVCNPCAVLLADDAEITLHGEAGR